MNPSPIMDAAAEAHRGGADGSAVEVARMLGDGFAAGMRAEDIYLAWLLDLPADIDPSFAATAMLGHLDATRPTGPHAAAFHRLRALLEETTSWPRPVLRRLGRQKR